jgi:FtsZ-interacting cell division protein ZipA
MKRRKGQMNILIMIAIIVIIDLIFMGYHAMTKHQKSGAPAPNAIVKTITSNRATLTL